MIDADTGVKKAGIGRLFEKDRERVWPRWAKREGRRQADGSCIGAGCSGANIRQQAFAAQIAGKGRIAAIDA